MQHPSEIEYRNRSENEFGKVSVIKMSKKLVAYFSASGVTKSAAEKLAEAAQADLYEIRPEVPYIEADLNWLDGNSRSSREMRDKAFRPALKDRDADVSGHDVIFLGFPIWWYVAPNIINTFLEAYDFSGKIIVLFATSGGSDFGKTATQLAKSVPPSAAIKEGRLLNGHVEKEELKDWIASLNL